MMQSLRVSPSVQIFRSIKTPDQTKIDLQFKTTPNRIKHLTAKHINRFHDVSGVAIYLHAKQI